MSETAPVLLRSAHQAPRTYVRISYFLNLTVVDSGDSFESPISGTAAFSMPAGSSASSVTMAIDASHKTPV